MDLRVSYRKLQAAIGALEPLLLDYEIDDEAHGYCSALDDVRKAVEGLLTEKQRRAL